MDKQLLNFQHSVYTAAIPYHVAQAECISLLFTPDKETLRPVAAKYNQAADEYEDALLVLWQFLDDQPKSEYIQRQLKNTLVLLNALNRSRDLVNGQLDKQEIPVPVASH